MRSGLLSKKRTRGYRKTRDLLGSKAEIWRQDNPVSGTSLGPMLDLFHDADASEFACKRDPDTGLELTIYQFDGSYLSLVTALPPAEVKRARNGRMVRLTVDAESTRPIGAFGRLNLRTQEQAEVLHASFILAKGERAAEFPLDGVRLPLGDLTSVWMDIILARPEMCEISISQLTLEILEP